LGNTLRNLPPDGDDYGVGGVGWGGLSGFPPVVLPHALLDIGTPADPSPSLYWFKIRISAKVDDAA